MSRDDFGATLRHYRRARRLLQSEVAEQVGVDVSTLRRWESGKTSPRGEKLAAVCRFLRIPNDVLGKAIKHRLDVEGEP